MTSTQLLTFKRVNFCFRCVFAACAAVLVTISFAAPKVSAAIIWDGEAETPWWFDPINWNENSNANLSLPPGGGGTATDTQINMGFNLNGEGVVYDPDNDPNFPPPSSISFPLFYGPQQIDHLYISRNATNDNLLTIKGDLEIFGNVVIGRSSGVDGTFTNGRIVQTGGTVSVPTGNFDIAGPDTSQAGLGNGVYEYRGGIFHVDSNIGLRLSHGTDSSNNITGERTGASGTARFIVGNPDSGGYVRAYNVSVASHAGAADGLDHRNPDGITRGVGIFEFEFENGGTRPFQVGANLSINNGLTSATGGVRSSRLELTLKEAVPTDIDGVPINLGLFDVDFDQFDLIVGSITGTGDLTGDGIENTDRVFSNGDGSVHYREGDLFSASFGSTTYNWEISYTGNISWIDADNSVVDQIQGPGTGTDIVLIGHSSDAAPGLPGDFDGDGIVDGHDFLLWQRNTSVGNLGDWEGNFGASSQATAAIGAVPEPTSLVLFCLGLVPLAGRRLKVMG